MKYLDAAEAIKGHKVESFVVDGMSGLRFCLDNGFVIAPLSVEGVIFAEEIAENMEKYGRTVTRVHLQPYSDCGESLVFKITVGGEQDAFSMYSRLDGVYYGG